MKLAVLGLMMLLGSTSFVGASAFALSQTDNSTACLTSFQASVNLQSNSLNLGHAIDLAKTLSQLRSLPAGLRYTYDSAPQVWTREANCQAVLDTVSPTFFVYNASSIAYVLAVNENPAMTSIFNYTTYPPSMASSTENLPTFSGYSIYGSSSANQFMYQAAADWYVPTGSQPSSTACSYLFNGCFLAEWVGLTPALNGSHGALAQDGIREDMSCVLTVCSTSYYGFYEMVPVPPSGSRTPCPSSFTVSPGDKIEASTTNEAINTGGSYLKYDFYMYDFGSSKACSYNGATFSSNYGDPYYAQFFMERYSGNALLNFNGTPVTFSGAVTYGNSLNTVSISTPYGHGWYASITMQTGGYTNINLGTVSGGDFTETWNTSNGT